MKENQIDILKLSERVGANAGRMELMLPRLLGPQYKYIQQQGADAFEPLKYEPKHQICHQFLLYFVSRIGIVYDPLTNKQMFYEGHRMKIGAMALHPKQGLVATGEVNLYPDIHIWNAQTLETLAIL